MATDKPEVSKLDLGMANDPPDRGPVLVNVHGYGEALRVRDAFGQIGQWDSTLRLSNTTDTVGVREVLRTYALRTDAGSVQVVTLLRVFGMTFDTAQGAGVYGQWAEQYVLHVYDETANSHAEFALYGRTVEVDETAVSPQDVRPWGNSNAFRDIITPRGATGTVKPFMFEMQDAVVFGSQDAGIWCYRPGLFEAPEQQTGTVLLLPSRLGEGACVSPLVGAVGQFTTYDYLPAAAWPVAVDGCVFDDRAVFAAGRSLFFTDRFNARSILAGNEVTLPLQGEIKAVASVFENLCVWTDDEFGIYRPKSGTFQTDGSWRLVSKDAGCAGPGAKFVSNTGVVWAGKRGLFSTSGQYDIEQAAPALQSLVLDGIGNPLSAFLSTQQVGYAPPTGDTPRLQWEWRDLDRISMAYDLRRQMLLVSLPSEQIILCRVASNWTILTTESRASNFPATVGVSSLEIEQLCSVDGRVFAACGPETFNPSGVESTPTGSWYLLEMGRGGAVDRSVELPEDNRDHVGSWTMHGTVTALDPVISLGKPTEIWQGWTASTGGNAIGANGGWLIPCTVQPSDQANGQPVAYIQADVTFNSARWQPLLVGAGPNVDVVWPNERLLTLAGWTITNPAAGQLSITYNSATNLNISRLLEQACFYIPMKRVTTAPSLGCNWQLANVPVVGVDILNNVQARLRTWGQFDRESKAVLGGAYLLHNDDDVAQPVDWLYKWAQMDGGGQVRMREIFLRALTRGQGSDGIASAWLWGLLNVYYSSDWKDWSGQVVDWSGFQNELASKTTPLRARVKNASAAMVGRVFGGSLKWGDTTNATKGNFLADDEQVDTLAFSDSVRGETLSLLLFGHVRDKAETLMLREVIARVAKMGGRRRIGR